MEDRLQSVVRRRNAQPVQPEFAYRECRQVDVNQRHAAHANYRFLVDDRESQLPSNGTSIQDLEAPRVHQGGVVRVSVRTLEPYRDIYCRTLGLEFGRRVTAALNGSAQALDRRA